MDIHCKADGTIGKNYVPLKLKDTLYLRSGMVIFASYAKTLTQKKFKLTPMSLNYSNGIPLERQSDNR